MKQNSFYFFLLSGLMSISTISCMNQKKAINENSSVIQRYGMKINRPDQNNHWFNISPDGQTVSVSKTNRQETAFALFGKKISITDTSRFSFDTYDLASIKRITDGAPYKIPTPHQTAFIKEVELTDSVTTALVGPEDSDDAGDHAHYFFDTKIHKPIYKPIINRYTGSTDDGNCHFFRAHDVPYYIYTKGWASVFGDGRETYLYSLNKDTNDFIYNAKISTSSIKAQQSECNKNLILFYMNGYLESDKPGYQVYDMSQQHMVQEVPVDGATELLNFTDNGKTVVTVANRYKGSWPSTDSSVQLYDIATGSLTEDFNGPTAKIVAVRVTEKLVVAVSLDCCVYVFDRVTKKLIKTISFPSYVVTNKSSSLWNHMGKEVIGQLRILDNKEIAFLINTASYCRFTL